MRSDFLPYGLQDISEDDISAVVETLRSDWITGGPMTGKFEDAVRKYVNAKHAVCVNSGTSALDIAIGCLKLPKGSEIITTPFTFVATVNSILYNDCKPVLADIRKDTYNINPEEVKKKITDKTKAIVCVDYAGQPCILDELKEISEENDLVLIEDAAHSIGAEYRERKVGSIADLTCFSFHPVKHITTGEGGMVATNNRDYETTLKLLRNHGINKDAKERFGPNNSWAYDVLTLGRNYRMTDFQAALGLSQLKRLDKFIEKRAVIANQYNKAFAEIDGITTPFVKKDVKHAWHIYTILLNGVNRDAFFNKMREKNIGVNVHYTPAYHFTYYKQNFGFKPENYPVTEDVFSRIITLPLFPKMTNEDVRDVIEAVEESL